MEKFLYGSMDSVEETIEGGCWDLGDTTEIWPQSSQLEQGSYVSEFACELTGVSTQLAVLGSTGIRRQDRQRMCADHSTVLPGTQKHSLLYCIVSLSLDLFLH